MEKSLSFVILSFSLAMLWAPLLISMLYKFKIVRHVEKDFSAVVGERFQKEGTPIMGGLLVVITVAAITIFFNWGRGSTYVPIGVCFYRLFLVVSTMF
jgi:UDP-N-acetylmuramyl pentapeptide phosphotransferase/UDP-N-acetylglucosamine-1-phosphate transferase